MAILIVCIPYVGYAGVLFSAAGLLIGLWALLRPGAADAQLRTAQADNSFSPTVWQSKGITHPLVGVAICLFTLLLALLPTFLHGLARHH
jgi:hypothetical protein